MFPPLRPPSVGPRPYMLPRWHTDAAARLLPFNAFWLHAGQTNVSFSFFARGLKCILNLSGEIFWLLLVKFG